MNIETFEDLIEFLKANDVSICGISKLIKETIDLRVMFYDDKVELINDLENLGLHQNKTFTLEYPNIDEKLERHFLRGYFDGDGYVSYVDSSKSPKCGIASSSDNFTERADLPCNKVCLT